MFPQLLITEREGSAAAAGLRSVDGILCHGVHTIGVWACQTLERSDCSGAILFAHSGRLLFSTLARGFLWSYDLHFEKFRAAAPNISIFSYRLFPRRAAEAMDVQTADFIIRFENLSVPFF